MKWKVFYTLAAVLILLGNARHGATAGTLLDTIQGRWTTRSASSCAVSYYDVTTAANEIRFIDQSGQTDVEEVVSVTQGEVQIRTTISRHDLNMSERVFTLWAYALLPDGRVRVRNLSDGRSFSLTRCGPPPTAASPEPAPAPRSPSDVIDLPPIRR